MDLWFTEKQTPHHGYTYKIKETLWREKTGFQDLAVVETYDFGRMMILDGAVQLTERDEFVYHEMGAHVPLLTHPNPKRVCVIGGGDGGVIREVVKHPGVELARLVDIDGRVIEASKKYFPQVSAGLTDPRVEVRVGDGIAHMKEVENEYDVVIVDSTDPVGPAEGLFNKAFYQSVYRALKEDGLMICQSEAPFIHQNLIRDINRVIAEIFPIAKLYWLHVPTYPSGVITFTLGSKKHDPLEPHVERFNFPTRYYTPEVHKAAFALPRFLEELIKG